MHRNKLGNSEASISGRPKVTVLICTMNEEESLAHVLSEIPNWVDEILLVDAHSTDNTVEIAKELRPDIRILYQFGKGKGDALIHGFKHASGDIIVTMDADRATDPKEIPKFISPLFEGYDCVKGSRFIKGSAKHKPFHRVIGNLIIVAIFDVLFFRAYTDMCSGYNSFWKRSIEQVELQSLDGFEDEPLINIRIRKAGLKVLEVGHIDWGRESGSTKAPSWRQGLKAIRTILRERFSG